MAKLDIDKYPYGVYNGYGHKKISKGSEYMSCERCSKCEECEKSTHRTDEEKKKLNKRLNIIEGQIRGIKQMFAEKEIEDRYNKKEILAMYFNTVYLGDGNYGFEAAANYYFQKPLRQCRLLEYAILVGMLPNPNYYSIVNNPDNSRKKVEQILSRLVKNNIIDRETMRGEPD